MLLAAAMAAGSTHGGGPASNPFALNGAQLGMSIQSWRALPRPGDEPDHVTAVCGPLPRPTTGSSPSSGPDAKGPDAKECRYSGKYGAFQLPESFPLAGRYRIRQPVFEFMDGRLTAIRFRTSTDAFARVMASLRRSYGQPRRLTRDMVRIDGVSLPRLRATWRIPGRVVTLTDPSADPDRLEVRTAIASSQSASGS